MSNLWDDIKDSAGRFAKIALDKTTNAVDITKLNLAKNETEGKISKLYSKIGEIIYTQYKDGAGFDGDISDALAEIDKFKAEAEEIAEQIAALKSTAACPECGQQNGKSSEYCSKCGAKLKEDDIPEAVEEAEEVDAAVDVAPEEE